MNIYPSPIRFVNNAGRFVINSKLQIDDGGHDKVAARKLATYIKDNLYLNGKTRIQIKKFFVSRLSEQRMALNSR